MDDEAAQVLKRFRAAKTLRDPWQSLLCDAFSYAAPEVDSGFQHIVTQGAQRRRQIYDSTASLAVEEAAAATHATLTPPHDQWFSLELTPKERARIDAAGGDSYQFRDIQIALDRVSELLMQHIDASNFHAVVPAAYIQEKISTGCLLMNPAPFGSPSAFQFEGVPLADIYPEWSEGGDIRTVFRCRKWPVEACERCWPGIELPAEVGRRDIEGADAGRIELIDAAVFDDESGTWDYMVLFEEQKKILWRQDGLLTSPFILFRSMVAPGEVLGRGRVLVALPDIKTCNKVVELVLRNAAIAVTGIWQADDDGVINPATIRLVPGAIIPKAIGSTGLTPLQSPGRFDVAQLVLVDLQKRIRMAIVGPELPPMDSRDNVTATEIDRRWSEIQLFRVPGLLRIFSELVVPLVSRGLQILSERGMLPAQFQELGLIGRSLKVLPTGRMTRAQNMADVVVWQTALQQVAIVAPQEVAATVDLPEVIEAMLVKAGLPQEFILDKRERAMRQQQQAQQAQIMNMARAAGDAAPMVRAVSGDG